MDVTAAIIIGILLYVAIEIAKIAHFERAIKLLEESSRDTRSVMISTMNAMIREGSENYGAMYDLGSAFKTCLKQRFSDGQMGFAVHILKDDGDGV